MDYDRVVGMIVSIALFVCSSALLLARRDIVRLRQKADRERRDLQREIDDLRVAGTRSID